MQAHQLLRDGKQPRGLVGNPGELPLTLGIECQGRECLDVLLIADLVMGKTLAGLGERRRIPDGEMRQAVPVSHQQGGAQPAGGQGLRRRLLGHLLETTVNGGRLQVTDGPEQ
ncbi:hypothetical protein D3C85_953010 [compost metagenome]